MVIPVLTPGPTTSSARVRPLRREDLPFTEQDRHGRRETDPVDALEVEEAGEQHAELVGGAGALGREPPVFDELTLTEEAERRLRVADVDSEEHCEIC